MLHNLSFFKNIIKNKKIVFYLVIVAVLGVFLMMLGRDDVFDDNVNVNEKNNEFVDGVNLGRELETVLSCIDGVGEIEIMVVYSDFGSNKNADYQDGLFGTKSSEPDAISGVIIVFDGYDDVKLRNEISEMVSDTLGIPLHKVKMQKMSRRML